MVLYMCRLIQPNKGKKPVGDSPAAVEHLHAATFKGGAPTEGCWCDLPPIGKRPLSPPSNARNFVTAAQTMAIEVSGRVTQLMQPWGSARCVQHFVGDRLYRAGRQSRVVGL
jgi:hypothetical protein